MVDGGGTRRGDEDEVEVEVEDEENREVCSH